MEKKMETTMIGLDGVKGLGRNSSFHFLFHFNVHYWGVFPPTLSLCNPNILHRLRVQRVLRASPAVQLV